jgi:hypothetical protein
MAQDLARYIEDTLLTLDPGEAVWTLAEEPLTIEALLAQPEIAAAPYLLVQREHITGNLTLTPSADRDEAIEYVTASAMGQWATLFLIQRTAGGDWESLPIQWRADEIDEVAHPPCWRAYGDRLRQVVYRLGSVLPEWEGALILNSRLTETFDENADAATPQRFVFVGWSPEDAAVVVDASETMAGIAFKVSRDGWSSTMRFGVFDLAQDRELLFPLRADSPARRSERAPPAPKRKR